MTFKLRYYQQDAVDITINFIKKSFDPCLLELATGAGKSLIVAEVAKQLKEISGKKVLCLAPSKELVEQNREKYLAYGEPASLFSASTGSKCLAHDVVFASPKSVLNSINKFGNNFAAVILDEAHGITPTIIKIIQELKERNPSLRVIGLTATPYRLGSGYIYRIDDKNNPVPETQTKNPFFYKLLYRVTTQELIDQSFLTPPLADVKEGYDTSELESKGKTFTNESVERVFEGQGRKTFDIVSQVVELSRFRMGVMFFAATIQHAKEIIESLPVDSAKLVTGLTKRKDRELIINQFKARTFKYLVNVSVLTTGFDAPHVDVVAVLRATESAGLFQQIIGRGLRLHDEKTNCLILDYAENIERHGLEDDLFTPEILVSMGGSEKLTINASCPACNIVNNFSGRPNKEDFNVDENGYFTDLAGDHVIENGQPLPAHFGRRCTGHQLIKGTHERCNYRWSFKACVNTECNHENDIAARYCSVCKSELVDPNEKLKIDFKRMKTNARVRSTDKVLSWFCQEWNSQQGNKSLRIDWTTEYRTFSTWYSPNSRALSGQKLWDDLVKSSFDIVPICVVGIKEFVHYLNVGGVITMPKTITARKEGDFFKVFAHNQPEDVLNEI